MNTNKQLENKIREIFQKSEATFDSKVKMIANLLNDTIMDYSQLYTVVEWPDIQMLMDKEGFDENAYLDVDCNFGSSAYFVRYDWYLKAIATS